MRIYSWLWSSSWHVGTLTGKWVLGSHGHVRVSVLSLSARSAVYFSTMGMSLEFSVHVPSKLLSCGHWQVELVLWNLFESVKLFLENGDVLFSSLSACSDSWLDTWVVAGWLLSDCDH